MICHKTQTNKHCIFACICVHYVRACMCICVNKTVYVYVCCVLVFGRILFAFDYLFIYLFSHSTVHWLFKSLHLETHISSLATIPRLTFGGCKKLFWPSAQNLAHWTSVSGPISINPFRLTDRHLLRQLVPLEMKLLFKPLRAGLVAKTTLQSHSPSSSLF